jgi:putative tryptophan/tyrosine transport system substrate-binding protein
MRRREFIALIGANVAWPFAALAQEPGRTYRLGLLWGFSQAEPLVTAFLDDVGRHGFIVGKNLTVDFRAFALHPDRLSEYAAELVKGQVDVISTAGNMALRVTQEATKTIPILAITDDLLGSRLVNSMARPSGNTTGISILASDMDGKRPEILIEAVPGIRRMAALADTNLPPEATLNALQEAARAGNIELSIHRIATGEEIAAGPRQGEGTRRHSTQCSGITGPLDPSSAYYGSSSGTAPTSYL